MENQNELSELKNELKSLRNDYKELMKLVSLGTKTAITMTETARLMGVSKSHLYRLVCQKKIPNYKAAGNGKITYFNKDEVTKWLLHHRVKTSSEIESKAATYCVTGKKGGAK